MQSGYIHLTEYQSGQLLNTHEKKHDCLTAVTVAQPLFFRNNFQKHKNRPFLKRFKGGRFFSWSSNCKNLNSLQSRF